MQANFKFLRCASVSGPPLEPRLKRIRRLSGGDDEVTADDVDNDVERVELTAGAGGATAYYTTTQTPVSWHSDLDHGKGGHKLVCHMEKV